jgi:hypothetical protein
MNAWDWSRLYNDPTDRMMGEIIDSKEGLQAIFRTFFSVHRARPRGLCILVWEILNSLMCALSLVCDTVEPSYMGALLWWQICQCRSIKGPALLVWIAGVSSSISLVACSLKTIWAYRMNPLSNITSIGPQMLICGSCNCNLISVLLPLIHRNWSSPARKRLWGYKLRKQRPFIRPALRNKGSVWHRNKDQHQCGMGRFQQISQWIGRVQGRMNWR